MNTEVKWYNINVDSSKELRDILISRKTKIEKALEDISFNTMNFISYFNDFILFNDNTLCKDLFENKLTFKTGKVVGAGKVGKASILEKNGVNVIIKSSPAKAPGYLSIRVITYIADVTHPKDDYWRIYDVTGNRKLVTAGGDNFANQTCQHLILNVILNDNVNYLYQYDAFYCDNIGYNITEFCNKGTLHDVFSEYTITDDIIFYGLSNVLSPLAILKDPKYHFNHSDLKGKNVFATDDGKKIIFKIADFDKSSITWNGIRFFNNSLNYLGGNRIIPQKDSEGDYVYKFNSSQLTTQVNIMHNPYGVPVSYDIYTFIISLFSIETVWNAYINERLPRLKSLMHKLFKGASYYVIMGRIAQDYKLVVSMSYINSILNDMDLLYDLSFVYTLCAIVPPVLETNKTEDLTIQISNNGHICTNTCGINTKYSASYKTCPTNRYSKQGITATSVYDWDYC